MGDGFHVFVAADDGSIPGGDKEEHERVMKERQLFELDQYYNIIAPLTFETKFIDISVEEGRAWREENRGAQLTPEQEQHMTALKQRIQEGIEYFTKNGKKVFFRLSTRSPKDAVDKLPQTPSILAEELQRVPPPARKTSSPVSPRGANSATSPSPQSPTNTTNNSNSNNATSSEFDDNAKLVALRKTFFRVMSVESTDDVMKLVMYSSRAISDMKRALDNLDISPWHMKVILREFVDIPIEGELRGFVYKNSLNALSQYYADCYFQDLVTRKPLIEKLVWDYFTNKVQKAIGPYVDSYIVDFIVMPDKTVKIVELNPFSKTTGPCLFDWIKDKNLIENGPFEMRVQKQPTKNVGGYLVPFKGLLEAAEKIVQSTKPVNNNANSNNSNINTSQGEDRCLMM